MRNQTEDAFVKVLAGLSLVGIGIVVIVCLSAIFSYPLMLLWNGCFVGAITGVQPVTWLQMWGLSVLFSSLFKTSVTNPSKS